jgi:hypothetical protein
VRDTWRTKRVSLSAPVALPIRLSLCRERLAWGVPQRATLLNAAAGRRKTRRVRNQTLWRALLVPAILRVLKMQHVNLHMYYGRRHLQLNGKSCLIKKFGHQIWEVCKFVRPLSAPSETENIEKTFQLPWTEIVIGFEHTL